MKDYTKKLYKLKDKTKENPVIFPCNKCGVPKELNEKNYHKDTRYPKLNYRKTCIDCIHARQKERREEKKMFNYY